MLKVSDQLALSFLTKLVKHLVTFIKNEVLDVLQVENFLTYEGQQTSRSTNHNVRTIVA